MAQHIYQIDAFTRTPFAGNPAAVCVLPEPASERWMQDVAREMNLSETAFLVGSEGGYCLRWFTPTVEVDLVRPRNPRQRARAMGKRARRALKRQSAFIPGAARLRRSATAIGSS